MEKEQNGLNVMFTLKNEKADGTMDIYCKITMPNKPRAMFRVGYSIFKSKWGASRVKGNRELANTINQELDRIKLALFKTYNEMRDRHIPNISPKEVAHFYHSPELLNKVEDDKTPTFVKFFKDHVQEVKESVGTAYSYNTFKSLNTTCNHIADFVSIKYDRKDIMVKDVGFEFLDKFSFYLSGTVMLSKNTVIKQLKNTKKIINLLIRYNHMDDDQVKQIQHFKIGKYSETVSYVSKDNLIKIIHAPLKLQRQLRTRDYFMFSCYTGVPYINLIHLTMDNIIRMEGESVLSYYRGKTNVASQVPLMPEALRIIDKYKNFQNGRADGLLFPYVPNQSLNMRLKEIAKIAGI